MAIPLIGAVLGLAGEVVREFVSDWKAKRTNDREVKRAVTENKIRLAQSVETNNQAWEMAQLEGRDIWLRRFSFAMWTWPIFWAGIDPDQAAAFFKDALAVLPEWYVFGYLGMTGAIWGLSTFKAMGGFKGVGRA